MSPSDKQKRDFFKTLRRKNAAVNIQRFLAAGVSIEERDSAGRTPLIIAARYGDLELVNTLLAAGANVEARDNDGITPLLHALTHNVVRPEVVQRLLQAGAQTNVPYGECYEDALSIVASHGYTNILPLLLQAGASVSRRSDGGFSLLLQAVGHPETFQALLAAGVNLHGGDPARLLLAGITKDDAADTAAWLRKQGITLTPEVVQREDADSYPVLVRAIYRTEDDDRLEHTLRMLLKLGADVNGGGSDRLYTPLTMAVAEECSLSIIRLLLEAGADVNSEVHRGFTALYNAVFYQTNHTELLRLLLEAGADIFARDSKGDTPYDYARRSDHAEQHLALLREYEHKLYPTDTP